MNQTKLIWKNATMLPWESATTHVLTHGLHYGSGVFEGIRCYNTSDGVVVFKLKEHVDRFFYSAKQLGMELKFSPNQIFQAILDTVAVNNIKDGYIRPLAYYGYGEMKVIPSNNLPVDVIIACWPWADYLPVQAVDVAISPYIRIHPKSSVTDAKISGHYVNSILSGLSINNTKYHEVLLLDVDGFVAEGSCENIFIVKNGELITTSEGNILVGITRDIVMQIARDLNIVVREERFKPQDIIDADEAFFCGTAVEIVPIRSLEDKIIGAQDINNKNLDFSIGHVTEQIKNKYRRITGGLEQSYVSSLSYVDKVKFSSLLY